MAVQEGKVDVAKLLIEAQAHVDIQTGVHPAVSHLVIGQLFFDP